MTSGKTYRRAALCRRSILPASEQRSHPRVERWGSNGLHERSQISRSVVEESPPLVIQDRMLPAQCQMHPKQNSKKNSPPKNVTCNSARERDRADIGLIDFIERIHQNNVTGGWTHADEMGFHSPGLFRYKLLPYWSTKMKVWVLM